MEIVCFPLPPVETNAYLLYEAQQPHALLIDAPLGVEKAIGALLRQQHLSLEGIYLTHSHFDHVLGVPYFQERGVPIFANAEHGGVLDQVGQQMERFDLPAREVAIKIDRELRHGECLSFQKHPLRILEAPGHCPGSVVIYFPEDALAFTGDTLFRRSVGRTDLPLSNFRDLKRSICEHIYTLPDETVLYPGHGDPTTVGEEKQYNPFVKP